MATNTGVLRSEIGGGPHGLAFTECGKAAGLLVVVKCRRENDAMKACLSRWYHDEDLKIQCTEEYLNERNEFRRTGVSRKKIQQAH
ncbi:COX assembly mitochondrial protein homolog isoform X3 [Bacillus rossius redtenbacheri]|uniref:COX assembly mitochondrial protein homolog isoform X3 n=1 Tax=Bacillus rossius redtenbacheri TaxID=93214 RepID=UPI002FDE8D72